MAVSFARCVNDGLPAGVEEWSACGRLWLMAKSTFFVVYSFSCAKAPLIVRTGSGRKQVVFNQSKVSEQFTVLFSAFHQSTTDLQLNSVPRPQARKPRGRLVLAYPHSIGGNAAVGTSFQLARLAFRTLVIPAGRIVRRTLAALLLRQRKCEGEWKEAD